MDTQRKRVALIGAGMAGLTAGAYLARQGHHVTVYEQASEPGGVTTTITRDGYSWDLGPLLLEGFGPGEEGSSILTEIGVPPDRVARLATDPADRGIVFPDFDLWRPAVYEGARWRRERLGRLFPADRAGLDRYYRFYGRMERLVALNRASGMRGGRAPLLDKARLAMNWLLVKRHASRTAADLMSDFFSSERLRAVYTGILADLMVAPTEFPALGVPLFNFESAFDARCPRPLYRYIRGGCGSLVAAAQEALTTAGGVVRTGAEVTHISTDAGAATGVVVNGTREHADIVLSTAGARETFYDLLDSGLVPAEYRAVIDGQVEMESVFMVHLGLDRDPPQPSALGYYYGTYDVEKGVRDIRAGNYHDGEDGFVLYIPSRHSPPMAPAGGAAVTIYTVAPNVINGSDWDEHKERYADHLVACAERHLPGLATSTRTRLVVTPADFRRRVRQRHHSFGGIAPVMNRPNPAYRTPIRGLWFAGSQSQGGGGVLGVMKGARAVVGEVRLD